MRDHARRRELSILGVVYLATLTVGLNATMMSVALPGAASDLGASAGESSWVLLVSGLVSTALLVPFGHVADVVARQRLFAAAVALTTVGGAAVAAASSAAWLVAGRGVQAVGMAVLLTNAAVILAGAFPGRRLGRAMGVYFAGFSTGHVLGPVLAGLVATTLGWRWLFWLDVPLGVVTLLWARSALRGLPGPTPGARLRIDVVGSLLLVVILAGVMVPLSRGPYDGWADPVVVAGLACAAVAAAVLPWWLRRAEEPAVDPTLFADRDFTVAFLAACAMIVPRMVTGVVVALYVQGVLGGTALQAAAVVVPLAVAVTVTSLLTGRAQRGRRDESVAFVTVVATAAGAAMLLLSVGTPGNVPLMVAGVTLVGGATGLFGAVNSSMLIRLGPQDAVGRTNAVRTLATNGSFAVGLAVALSVVTVGLPSSAARAFFSADTEALTPDEVSALVLGYRVLWGVVLVVLLLVAVATWRAARRSGSRHATLAAAAPRP